MFLKSILQTQITSIFGEFEILLVLLWLGIVMVIALAVQQSLPDNDPGKPYFLPGLFIKLIGGIGVGLIYEYNYRGGDTFSYFYTSGNLVICALNNPFDAFNIFFINKGTENLGYHIEAFSQYHFAFTYYYDTSAYFVSKFITPLTLLGFLSYYPTTILVASFSYIGIWGLYRTVTSYYPTLFREMAIAVLFIPSVFAWGSGIFKDSITLSMLGISVYAFHSFFVLKKRRFFYFVVNVLACYCILNIKPYIVLCFLPFAFYWIGAQSQQNIKSGLARFVFGPFLLFFFVVLGLVLLQFLTAFLPQYALENVFAESNTKRMDLLQAYNYADGIGSTYDIGDFEPNLTGAISKLPISVWTTFFRPYIFESRNPVMFVAAIESSIMILFLIVIAVQTKGIALIKNLFRDPFVTFAFGFSIAFAFMCGLTSGNFGNLVRYKIPCLPFFVASLFIARYYYYYDKEQELKTFTTISPKTKSLVNS